MNILHVIPYFIPAWTFGGPVEVCYRQIRQLAKHDHKVTVATTDICTRDTRIKKLYETVDNVTIIRFRNINTFLVKKFNIYTPIGYFTWLLNNIHYYDIIHLHDYFTILNIMTVFLCVIQKKPYVIQPHGSCIPLSIRKKIIPKKIFNIIAGYWMLLRAKKIICISENEKNAIASYYPKLTPLLEILPNGINKNPAKISLNKKNKLRLSLGYKKNDIIILLVSRLSFVKGVDLFIKSFRHLVDKNHPYIALIAGPDEGELSRLKHLVSEYNLSKYIQFLGYVHGNTKNNLFSISDIFVSFSLSDPFGITVLEALNYKLPVCISKNIGIQKYIKKYSCGFVVDDVHDEYQCAAQIERTLSHKKMFAKNTKIIIDLFDTSKIGERLIHIYKELI